MAQTQLTTPRTHHSAPLSLLWRQPESRLHGQAQPPLYATFTSPQRIPLFPPTANWRRMTQPRESVNSTDSCWPAQYRAIIRNLFTVSSRYSQRCLNKNSEKSFRSVSATPLPLFAMRLLGSFYKRIFSSTPLKDKTILSLGIRMYNAEI